MADYATDLVAYHAQVRPASIAIESLETGEVVSWALFEDRVARLAGVLATEFGVRQGDRVAVLAENDAMVLYVQFACFRIGAMFVPYSWRLAAPELEFCCKDIEPAVLLHDGPYAELAHSLAAATGVPRVGGWGGADGSSADLSEQLAGAEPLRARRLNLLDDTAQLLYTSGTTGMPKAAICTFASLVTHAANVTLPMTITTESRHLAMLPFFHAAGINAITNPVLMNGGCVVVSRRFDPEQAVRLISDPANRMTHFSGAPAMYQVMAPQADHGDYSTMVLGQVGGGYLAPDLMNGFAERGLICCSGYGATEMGPSATNVPPAEALRKPTSLGIPVQHTHLRVVTEDGDDAAVGEIGEVWVSGPAITKGYWRRDVDVDGAFHEGWFRSGDAVRADEDGFLYMTGRFKDMYKSGGENVFMAEVEAVLIEHPAIAEVAIIGVRDARWGEVGRAVVVATAGSQIDLESISQFCAPRLARFKIPASVVVLDEPLPRNVTGKVIKAELRTRFGEASE
jgi:fatty-acyl-CoA synthase